MNPRVSVVIPAYNYSRFLPETFGCLVRQTLGDWECVVVDDGSTDDTRNVAERFARSDSRIRYHHQENRGLPGARNAGVALSGGRYIQFLDADDLLAPEKLEVETSFLDSHPEVQICYSNYRPMDSATGRMMERWTERMLGPDPLEDFLLRWELDLCIPIHCALFRRSLWGDTPVFDENVRAKEDWIFWVDLALRNAAFHFIDRDHAFYRMHESNMFQRHGEMTSSLVEATLRILLRIPEAYRERFIDASIRRVRRSLDHWLAQEKVRFETERKVVS